MEYGDKFRDDGTLQAYSQHDEFVFAGARPQAFQSRFNYHAFRYVIVKGMENEPALKDIDGHWISTDYATTSEFSSSNDLMNWIAARASGAPVASPSAAMWSTVPAANASLLAATPALHGNGPDQLHDRAPIRKWLPRTRADPGPRRRPAPHRPQRPDSGRPTAWSGICITMPWMVYQQYGDTRVLEQSYPTMQRYLAFLETKQKDGILAPYFGVGYTSQEWSFLGDWVSPNRGQGADSRVDETPLFSSTTPTTSTTFSSPHRPPHSSASGVRGAHRSGQEPSPHNYS